jgi:cell division protein FtsB
MYTQKKPIENTHIVRERDRRRNRELLAVLSLGVPIGLFLLLFTWQNLEVIRLGREATRLQKELKETETTHKSLEAELDRLTSFDTVEKQVSKLGFEPAHPETIVMVTSAGPGSAGTARNAPSAAPSTPGPQPPAGGR